MALITGWRPAHVMWYGLVLTDRGKFEEGWNQVRFPLPSQTMDIGRGAFEDIGKLKYKVKGMSDPCLRGKSKIMNFLSGK